MGLPGTHRLHMLVTCGTIKVPVSTPNTAAQATPKNSAWDDLMFLWGPVDMSPQCLPWNMKGLNGISLGAGECLELLAAHYHRQQGRFL
jgi:hypothetical protein